MTSIGPKIPTEVEGILFTDLSNGVTELYQDDIDQVRDKARRLDATISDLIGKCQSAGFRPVITSHMRRYLIYAGHMHERSFVYHVTVGVDDGDGNRHNFALISSFNCYPRDDGRTFEVSFGMMNNDCSLEYARLDANGCPVDDSIMDGLTPDDCIDIILNGKAGE